MIWEDVRQHSSDNLWALEWLTRFRDDRSSFLTSLGRRWLTKAIGHLEECVEADLRTVRPRTARWSK